jgi:trimeric autotransporter adhesin
VNFYHSLIVTGTGRVFGCGRNVAGQIGETEQPISSTLKEIALPMGFISVSSGYYHTVAVAVDGTLWSWGGNNLSKILKN